MIPVIWESWMPGRSDLAAARSPTRLSRHSPFQTGRRTSLIVHAALLMALPGAESPVGSRKSSAVIAQQVERRTCNAQVMGSIPIGGSISIRRNKKIQGERNMADNYKIRVESIAEEAKDLPKTCSEDIICDGFALLTFDGEDPCDIIIQHVNTDEIAKAIVHSSHLRAGAALADGMCKAADIIKKKSASKLLSSLMGADVDSDE